MLDLDASEALPVRQFRAPRLVRDALAGALAIGATFALAGCETSLGLLVGEKGGKPATASLPPVANVPPNAAFLSDSDLKPGFSAEYAIPPTLPTDSDTGPTPPENTSSGPRPPIAVVPISSDPAALAGLGQAANRLQGKADGRFVLLVLTPPAADAAALDRGNTASRAAVTAAVKALGDAGIAADMVEISLATNPDVGKGEMRLYAR